MLRKPQAVPTGAAPCWFIDISDEVGLDFRHDCGPAGDFFMPQAIGSGAAVFDIDGRGQLAILLLQNGGPNGAKNQLYRQLPNGKFENISTGSGLDFAGYNMGVAIGDVNNDGLPDVFITQYGGIKLFINQGNGKFIDQTKESGLDNHGAWGASAAFLDYDRDGWLDLVVVNYVSLDPSWKCTSSSGQRDFCAPSTFPGTVARLFHNRGKSEDGIVRFEDVTTPSGLYRLEGPGLGVVCADFNGDGWPDIFVANDGKPNHLWINQKNGTFKEEAVVANVAFNGMGQSQAGMGVAFGDADGDGLFDLFVTHLTEETNTLWLQGPRRGKFRDMTIKSGLSRPRWRATGFGTVMGDFDNDGWNDIAVVNGRVSRGPMANAALGPLWGHYAERNQLFANNGQGVFRDISEDNPALCGTPNVARGLAVADMDGDGGLDLLVTTIGGRARLFRNVAPNRGHWLLVRAVDPALHRDAYGAEIKVYAQGRSWVRWINPATSFLCSNDVRAHFGLGAVPNVDSIEVLWPSGEREIFDGCAADQKLELRKGGGKRP
ncbi:MAG TPA: CRTAC1 family protein [Gemmataceae bacterium]|nr:CRTAC1 family protein [Gemmataceae bacterium]